MSVATSAGPDDAFRLHQYDKIIRLGDSILAGQHPKIKLRPNLPLTGASASEREVPRQAAQSALSRERDAEPSRIDAVVAVSAETLPTPRDVPKELPKLNPIFLEKSTDLVRAELQIQRQRIERAIREDVEQRRYAKNTQAENTANFDLSEVLAKAVTLVHSIAGAASANEDLKTTNDAASNSSNSTFYSSQVNTPESQLTSLVRNEPVSLPTAVQIPASYEPAIAEQAPEPVKSSNGSVPSDDYEPAYEPAAGPPAYIPGLMNRPIASHSSTGPSGNDSGAPSQTDESGHRENRFERAQAQGVLHPPNDAYAEAFPPSPLLRSHGLATQAAPPRRNTPLLALQPLATDFGTPVTAAPAQVAILRREQASATSPDGSPRGGGPSDREKRKAKKKKRKAERQAAEPEITPYIKPEPRSASPITAASYLRPSKRPRRSQRSEPEVYEVPPHETPIVNGFHIQRPQPVYPEGRVPLEYRAASAYPRAASTALHNVGRPAEYHDDRPGPGDGYARTPMHPPAQYAPPVEVHHERPSSRALAHVPYAEPPRGFYEPYEVRAPPMSARPELEYYMAPARPQSRIVVDAMGREYIEPARTPVRAPGAPPQRPEGEVLYERAPPPTMPPAPRYPAPAPYDDGEVVYAGSSMQYAAPRRVVSQPEPSPPEYRYREYSSRPMPPPGQYVEVMSRPERRPLEDGNRQYGERAMSMLPAGGVPYEAPDYRRLQSVRPEAPVREYAPSMYPDGRRSVAYQNVQYGERAPEYASARPEYGARPVERYYEPQPPTPAGGHVTYIERQ